MKKKIGKWNQLQSSSVRRRKPEETEQDYEWQEEEFLEDEEAYYESEEYAEEDEEEYYESEEYAEEDEEAYYESEGYAEEDGAYYETEAYEEDEEAYCESEEYDELEEETYYESEASEDEYYEALAEDDGIEPEISMETMEMVPLDYLEEEALYDTEEYEPVKGSRKKAVSSRKTVKSAKHGSGRKNSSKKKQKSPNGLLVLWEKLSGMTAMDKIVAATGVLVFAVVLVTCSFYASAKAVDAQVEAFAEVSERLDGIGVAGEIGLLAVADAELAKRETADLFEEETGSQEEETGDIRVGMNMTSVEKDLKIKFINEKTKKLIANAAFEVDVTGPDKKTVTWKDDDKDGIIYKKDIASGKYQVAIKENDAIKEYQYDTSAQSVTVKDKIEYKKIDVVDEIKTESQVNAAKEDTAKQEAEAAPALQDTVEWVESSKTVIGEKDGEGGYEEVRKEKITDPLTVASIGGFSLLSSAKAENSDTGKARSAEAPSEAVKPSETESTKPSESGTTKPNESESAKPSESESTKPSESGSGTQPSSSEPESKPEDTAVAQIQINGDKATIDVGGGITLSAIAKNAAGNNVNASISWSSDKTDIADVNSKGEVTGKKAGEAHITAAAGGKTASFTVTVKANKVLTVQLKDATVKVGESLKISPAITSSSDLKSQVWSISDTAIAEIAQDGTVKGKKAGTATVSLKVDTADGQSATASCKLTVTASGFTVTLDKTSANTYTELNNLVVKATVSGTANGDKYEWSSDNTKYAAVSAASDGKSITIKGIETGTANITLKVTRGTETASATCKVNVKLNPKKDKVTKLKDNDGYQLYVKKDGSYAEAVLADYYTADKLYKKIKDVEYKYTGWQTLDGKTYYFTKDGKKVTGEQVIKGAKYTFDSEGVLQASSGVMGIDVSKWNAKIDWTAVRNSGVSYVIIRCGYRGSSTGAMIVDPMFQSNIKGATNAGLKVGIYFFSQAVDTREAVEEASMTLSLIKGYKISYPVFLDIEGSGGRGDRIDRNTRTAVAQAFCETIRSGGYTAGVYANKSWFETMMNTGSLTGYKLWLAQYAATPTYKATRYDLWQYTSKGSINGISGNVDLNISYLGY